MKTEHEKDLEIIENEIAIAEHMDDEVSSSISAVDDQCCLIIEQIFALHGITITYDQADVFLCAIGGDTALSYRRFLEKAHRLLKCKKEELQNWLDLGENAAINFV